MESPDILASFTKIFNCRGQTNYECLGSQEEYSIPLISKYTKKKLEKGKRVRKQDEDSVERHGNEYFSKW